VGWVGTLLFNTSGGPILATTEGGKHWARQLSVGASAATWLRFFDSKRGYALEEPFGAPGSPPVLYGTFDGGFTWTRIDSPPNLYGNVQTDFADFEHGWFATQPFEDEATRYRLSSTSDGGAHWTELVDLVPGRPESNGLRSGTLEGFWFADARHGWLMAGGPGRPVLYSTDDGGRTWQRQ